MRLYRNKAVIVIVCMSIVGMGCDIIGVMAYADIHVLLQVPSIDQTVQTLTNLLDVDGHAQACFLTHSLGSTAVSWMLHDTAAKSRVGATVMLDPVTFLLCDPTVASNFIHRDPVSTFEFLVHFFVARELHVANALSR